MPTLQEILASKLNSRPKAIPIDPALTILPKPNLPKKAFNKDLEPLLFSLYLRNTIIIDYWVLLDEFQVPYTPQILKARSEFPSVEFTTKIFQFLCTKYTVSYALQATARAVEGIGRVLTDYQQDKLLEFLKV